MTDSPPDHRRDSNIEPQDSEGAARDIDEESALRYHRFPVPGKLSVVATKPLVTPRDLSLAYSPGVAQASLAIHRDPDRARDLTVRSNLVGVISNGTAVLGLGNIGPLASKPVMEGKAVLFKKFSGIDCFDIEVDATDVDQFCQIVASLEPTFGGINLEDIAAPKCFQIERRLRETMGIPVFHDDQHGTAIIVGAATLNALRMVNKSFSSVKVVAVGAGAAGIACLDMLCALGVQKSHIALFDRSGLVTPHRPETDPCDFRAVYARSDLPVDHSLSEALEGADLFLGVSAAGVLSGEMITSMNRDPVVLALANPVPEIMPEEAKAAREDVIIATGRSDYPNQVNNVLCFPFIFRGALDVGATTINEPMKLAAVRAIADLGLREPDSVSLDHRYTTEDEPGDNTFGRDHIIPRPFDTRLITHVAPCVAKAACDSGVATRPKTDFEAYAKALEVFVYRSGSVMKPVIARARQQPMRIAYAAGEHPSVLRGVQQVVDDRLAYPILIARPKVLVERVRRLGLRLEIGRDIEVVNPESDSRYRTYHETYHGLMRRKGVNPTDARLQVRTNHTIIASLMVRLGDADGALCGLEGRYDDHMGHVQDIVGIQSGVQTLSAMMGLVLRSGIIFLLDTHVVAEPSVDQLIQSTELAVVRAREMGVDPKVALLSHSNFGSRRTTSSQQRMCEAVARLQANHPEWSIDGEMQADAALWPELRQQLLPESLLEGSANILVMPGIEAANIGYNLLKALADGVPIGPMLLGVGKPVHILTIAATPRTVYNMTGVTADQAWLRASQHPARSQSIEGE